MTIQKHLIVVGGPTASGKTSTAIQLAQHFKTEIISADSRQFFREMQIGTAVPNSQELAAVKHHFIQSKSVDDPYNVGEYTREALPLLDQLFEKNDVLILVGGSGLYIQGLCEGMDTFPDVPEEISQQLQADYETYGLSWLQEELNQTDPDYYAIVDRQNPVRLLRALGVIRASGKSYSSFRTGKKAKRNFQPIYLRMEMDRAKLYERINLRVDQMIEKGLLEEAKSLYHKRALTALQTVGYQELFDHFEGTLSLEEAINLIKQNSRRYAKRQETWFRKRNFHPFPPIALEEMIQYINKELKPFGESH